MSIYLPKKILIKAKKPVQVKPHVRQGKRVSGYTRQGQVAKIVAKKRKFRLKANQKEMQDMSQIIDKNIGYLIYMGKVIATAIGLTPRFYDSQPVGDLEDLVQEGKFGMMIGGMQWIKNTKAGKAKVDQLTQMKTRAKIYMRLMAQKLRSEVSLPRDVVKDLAIVSTARHELIQQKDGGKITAEEIADMVTLRKRTREGGFDEYVGDEKVERIEALMTYREAQFREDFEIHPLVSEKDVRFWTRYTYDQRKRREVINKVVERLVDAGTLTIDQRDILYLKFYFDQPDYARKERSFETIAKLFDKKAGIKYVRVRSKVGDKHRFTPSGRKTAITARIVKIQKKQFWVSREGKKKEYRIHGKPPLVRIKGVNKKIIWENYTATLNKLFKQPELKSTWEKMKKSVWNGVSKSLALFIPSLQVSTTCE